jgi:hypothetical protein
VPSKVELFEQIRRGRRLDELSARELAQRHGVHRRTVRQALDNAVPPPRKPYASGRDRCLDRARNALTCRCPRSPRSYSPAEWSTPSAVGAGLVQ